ncbi:MAG: TonB-dependent siderophore receptor [Verrucomicrobia bacterium]|nr:TonB-dependent siderophore receptor [Verrucomicrobiota bacterium]
MKLYPPIKLLALIGAFALASIAPSTVRAQSTTTTATTPATTIPADQEENPIKLSPFEVRSDNNVGYGASSTSTASRVAQAYIDVPQTVNVITSQYIDDLNIIDERALLQNVPNVLLGFDTNNSRIIRASQVNATYMNGMLQLVTAQAPPIAFFDRVEIVKGPSSAGFGVGEPGGIINYVSKTPTGVNRTKLSLGVGNYDNYKFAVDTQGISPTMPKLSYRLNAFWDQGNYRIPVWVHKGAGAQLALKYQIDAKTTAQLITGYSDILTPADNNLSAIWQQSTLYTVWRSLTGDDYPALPNTPRNPGNSVQDWAKGATLMPNNFNPNPPWGGFQNQSFNLTFLVDHSFNEHLHLRNSFETSTDNWTYKMSQISSLQSNPVGFPPGLYTDIARNYSERQAHGLVDDIDFLADYKFNRFIHSKTLIGAVYSQVAATGMSYQPAEVDSQGRPTLASLANPSREQMGDPADKRLYTSRSAGRSFGTGWYIQEDLGLFDDRLTLSASWRNDYQHSWGLNYLTQTSGNLGGWKDNKGVPRFSVSVKPTKNLTIYGLYSEHADPLQSTGKYFIVLGNPDAATRAKYGNFAEIEYFNPGGKLVEGGIKGTYFDGKLTFSFNYFHEINTGQVFGRVQQQDYDASGKQVDQIGINLISGVNAHGYEWEIFGQPTERLSFIVNYGQTKGHYPDFGNGNPHWWGQAPGMFGHGKYDFGDLKGNGWYVTFGGQYFWGYWNYQDPYVWQRAGQYSMDAGIGFRWDHGHQSIYLNDNNFTNQLVVVGNEDNVPWTVLPHEQGYITYTYTF